MSSDEMVLCIPLECFKRVGLFQGFRAGTQFWNHIIDMRDRVVMLPRSKCEHDQTYKQLVTYSIIVKRFYGNRRKYFSYERGPSGGEKRLNALRSIGIGGHVGAISNSFPDLYQYCRAEALRELNEEIDCTSDLISPAGFINDDSNDVGKVHFGLVYYVWIDPDGKVNPIEDSQVDCLFLDKEELQKDSERYESWSQILIGSPHML